MFKEENQINREQKLEFEIPAAYYDKVGVELHTSFSNKLTDDFNVYLPEYFYDIDLSQVMMKSNQKLKK